MRRDARIIMQPTIRFSSGDEFRWSICLIVIVIFLVSATGFFYAQQPPSSDTPTVSADASGNIGNGPCGTCHAGIYASYERSAMAHSSGSANENLVTGEFTLKPSGVHYSVFRDTGKVWLSFSRPDDPQVDDKRELLYFLGQGHRARTYLFSLDDFVFESPVNWYAGRQTWDVPPAKVNDKEMPLRQPVTTSCLQCHVSGVHAPVSGTENLYTSSIFSYTGVTCERCHGPGAAHVNNGGAIINPAKLAPKLRGQVCMQCHLDGNPAIERPSKHAYDYRPGEDLSQYVRYFVVSGSGGPPTANQFVALAQSTCKKKSGDAMTCISCHDPHRSIEPEDRVAFYRTKCLTCHGGVFAFRHHPKQPDCTSCHMPQIPSTNAVHSAVTDHRILRQPQSPSRDNSTPAVASGDSHTSAVLQLTPFPPDVPADPRDLALAWHTVNSGTTAAASKSEQFLREALKTSPDDPAILSALGSVAEQKGDNDQAHTLYQKALQQDPSLLEAAANLGNLEAKQGHIAEAIKLWQPVFERAPAKSEIGINLTRAYCNTGQLDAARKTVSRVLRFNPDLGSAKKLVTSLNASPAGCAL
jgi:hypothetical protein